jgi:hypothetical protein
MDPALASASGPAPVAFKDGLGTRRLAVDRARHETVEMLCLRGELTAVPSFEFALRERVSHLAGFSHACYGHVRSVDRLKDPASTLALASDVTAGMRLSEMLRFAEAADVTLDVGATLCLLRQLVPAVAMLHENMPNIAHGAIAPERLVVTQSGRLIVVEHVMGSALEQLRFSPERYWRDLRVALPRSPGLPRFDQRADVTQLGVVALSLILGRRLHDEEEPSRLGDLVSSAWAVSARGGLEPLPAGLRAWLMCALQLDARNAFSSAIDAREELERVLGESDYLAAPATLESFLQRYRAAAEPTAPMAIREPPRPIHLPGLEPVHGAMPEAKPVPVISQPGINQPDITRTAAAPIELSPIAVPTPAPPAATVRTLAPAHSPTAPSSASASLPSEPPAPVLAPPPVAVRKEPAVIAAPLDLSPTDRDTPRSPNRRRQWQLAAAAVALITLAGAGVTAARRYVAPRTTTNAGRLTMSTNPPGAKLFVDGVKRGVTPLTVTLEAGAHALELRGDGPARLMPITMTAGAQVSQYIELPKTASTFGHLQVRTDPAGARVSVDGVPRGSSPVTVAELMPGEHTVLLDSERGSVKQIVTIEAGITASLMVPLGTADGAPVSGWIAVTAPADVQVFENARLIGTSESDRLMVSAGRHDIEVVNEALGYRTARTVQVVPGKVTPVKIDFPKGTIALNAAPWAEVWVDGEKVGETPIGNLSLAIGSHEIVFRHPDLGEQRHAATVTLNSPARLSVDLRAK